MSTEDKCIEIIQRIREYQKKTAIPNIRSQAEKVSSLLTKISDMNYPFGEDVEKANFSFGEFLTNLGIWNGTEDAIMLVKRVCTTGLDKEAQKKLEEL